MRSDRIHGLPKFGQTVPALGNIKGVRKGPQDGPIFLGLTGRESGAGRHLGAAFGVDIGHGFFGVGCGRKDHVGAVRASIAMGANIYGKGCGQFACIDFIGATEEQDVKVALLGGGQNASRRLAALARKRANIKRPDAARRGVEDIEAVPVFLHHANCGGSFCCKGQNRCTIGAGKGPLPR